MWSAGVDALSTIAAGFNLLVAVVFVAAFAREPWRRTWFGQSVMILAIAIGVFSLLGVLVEALGPDYPLRDEVRLLGRALVGVAMTQRLVVLVRLRRGDRPR